MIYNTDARQLHKKGEKAIKMFQTKAKSLDERIALYNYIAMIYPALADVRDGKYKLSPLRVFPTKKEYFDFLKLRDRFDAEIPKMFIRDKEFHKEYISDIFVGATSVLSNVLEQDYSLDDKFSGKEFFDVFYSFMQSLGIEKLFLDLLKNGQIYGIDRDLDATGGYTIFNPFTGESDIFINYFDFDVSSMFVLAHEFGHVYDFQNYSHDLVNYNRYQYQSFYQEVISKLFERLFIDFMLKNAIKTDATTDTLFDMESKNYEFLYTGYIFSLLKDSYIDSYYYKSLTKDDLAFLVKDGFKSYKQLKRFLDDSRPLDLEEDMAYLYGDIISMFLFERIKDDNYSLDSLKLFFENCHDVFDIDSFMSVAGSSAEYLELYKKETKILVK